MVWPPAPMAPCDPAQTGCLRLGCRHLVPQADALPKLRETARGFVALGLQVQIYLYVYFMYLYRYASKLQHS